MCRLIGARIGIKKRIAVKSHSRKGKMHRASGISRGPTQSKWRARGIEHRHVRTNPSMYLKTRATYVLIVALLSTCLLLCLQDLTAELEANKNSAEELKQKAESISGIMNKLDERYTQFHCSLGYRMVSDCFYSILSRQRRCRYS